jgi:hypothetical protein
MNSSENKTESVGVSSDSRDEATGLPWFRTWRGVYLFVFGSFVLWVALLLALTLMCS